MMAANERGSIRRRGRARGEVTDDGGGFALAAREVVIGVIDDHDLRDAVAVGTQFLGGAVLVVFSGQEQQGTLQPPELGGFRKRWQLEVVRPEREAEQGERGHAIVIEGLPQRHAGAERPAEDERRLVGTLADGADRRSDVPDLLVPAAVGAGRAHDAAEVEAERREAAFPCELVPDGPQDRMVFAATVSRVGMADHR